jgi:hypothetical protein
MQIGMGLTMMKRCRIFRPLRVESQTPPTELEVFVVVQYILIFEKNVLLFSCALRVFSLSLGQDACSCLVAATDHNLCLMMKGIR